VGSGSALLPTLFFCTCGSETTTGSGFRLHIRSDLIFLYVWDGNHNRQWVPAPHPFPPCFFVRVGRKPQQAVGSGSALLPTLFFCTCGTETTTGSGFRLRTPSHFIFLYVWDGNHNRQWVPDRHSSSFQFFVGVGRKPQQAVGSGLFGRSRDVPVPLVC
jgi:hypothetical protein